MPKIAVSMKMLTPITCVHKFYIFGAQNTCEQNTHCHLNALHIKICLPIYLQNMPKIPACEHENTPYLCTISLFLYSENKQI